MSQIFFTIVHQKALFLEIIMENSKPPYRKKEGDWYIYPYFLTYENLSNVPA